MTEHIPWASDPHYFLEGENVQVFSFGRWYPGTVDSIGRTLVKVTYATGSGKQRTKTFPPAKVRPTSRP
jgi:hypothetical protein